MPAVKATKLNIANATSRILELEKRRFISFAPEKLKFDSSCCPGLVGVGDAATHPAGIPPQITYANRLPGQNKRKLFVCNVL
jgi:hypothetical protein